MDLRLPYIIPFAVAALGILTVAFMVLRHRSVRGGRILFMVCLAAALWSTTEGLLFAGFSKEANMLITKIQYIGIAALPPLSLMMVFVIFGLTSPTTRVLHYALHTIAILIIAEVWLNDFHLLHFTEYYVIDTKAFPMFGVAHGPLWYIVIAYHYLILLVVTIIIIRRLRSPVRIYRGQARVLLVSLLVVWIANGIYVTGLSPVENMDTGPIAFSIVAVGFAWGFLKFNLFDIVPAAKEEIFLSLRDPILILDHDDRIMETNPAASDLLAKKESDLVGTKLTATLPSFVNRAATETKVETAHGDMYFEVKINDLKERRGKTIGRLLVMHDITKRKLIEDELKKMASTDALTGASNRRHLLELAERDFVRAKRYGHSLCTVMIDIDRFKRLNDRYGHNVGDEALRRLVQTCKNEIRGGDIFGRIGGEEFVTVYANQSLDRAVQAAERLREQIAAITVPTSSGEIGFTASFGVAAIKDEDENFDDLLKRADTALYAAKNAGRNCVKVGT